jgi:hypothetical protein
MPHLPIEPRTFARGLAADLAGARPGPCARAAAATLATLLVTLAGGLAVPAQAQGTVVYRCPGPPVLYTDQLTPEQARARGCRTIEAAPVTVVQLPRKPAPATGADKPASRPADAKVAPQEQRERDRDRRQILQQELQREQAKLIELQREYNGGQPERRGDERNYQRYLDRVADMKARIARTESDVAALRRELDRLPGNR